MDGKKSTPFFSVSLSVPTDRDLRDIRARLI